VLAKYHKTLGGLGDGLSHEATVIIKPVNITFISSVEEDGATTRIIVSVIHKVSLGVSIVDSIVVVMVNVVLKEELWRRSVRRITSPSTRRHSWWPPDGTATGHGNYKRSN